MAFFSIIIPLYNKEKYVENALKSILNQTIEDYEIIIVDDGSTDKSREIVSKYISNKIRIIDHSKNKGLSAARNTGIKNATSNYITFLDADDLWKPKFLETIKSLIDNFDEARIFATNYEEIYPNKTLLPHNGSENLADEFEGYVDFFKINLKQGIYNHGSVCFYKQVFEKAGYYDETIDFAEDIDFNIRVNYYFRLAYSNTIQMSYLMQSENQLTTSSILNKKLPDYDKYEVFALTNPNIKKYLDFERYVLAKHIKVDGNYKLSKKISRLIDLKNLNWKQKLLLKAPVFFLKTFSKTKLFLIRKGIKISTYSN